MADKPVGKPRSAPSKALENDYRRTRTFIDDTPMEEIIAAPPPESKSWDEYESMCKLVRAKANDVQRQMELLFKEWTAFEGMTLKAYKKMPTPDAMFSDGPLSPARMQLSFRQNLAKLGWRWAIGLPYGPEVVKPFFAMVDEACSWGTRIVKDKERAEAIERAKKTAQKAQDDIKTII